MLRGSGSERGTVGTGAPGGAPGCGTAMLAVSKCASTSSTTCSGVPRTVVK